MIGLLLTVVLSGNTYTIVKDCAELAKVYFPLDDTKENRILYVCPDYPGQMKQLEMHELLHICMHAHQHAYRTQEEMDKHLHEQKYSEEYFATIVSPCIIENKDKLSKALELNSVNNFP